MLGKIRGRRRKGHQRIRLLDSITDAVNMNLGKVQETVRDRKAWRAAVREITESDTTGWLTEQQQHNLKGNEQD